MGKRKDLANRPERPIGFYCKLNEDEYNKLSDYSAESKRYMGSILRDGIILNELMRNHKDLKDLYDKYREESDIND